MFNIIKEVTIDYFERQMFISLIQFNEKTFIEIANRQERIILLRIKNLEQGGIIINQIMLTLNNIGYFETVDLLQSSFKSRTIEEGVFLVRTYKNKFTYKELEMLCKIYKLKKEINSGSMTIEGKEYDLCYYVSFKHENKLIGKFIGKFKSDFIFIKK